MTAQAEGSFGRAARPHRAQVDADWRQDRDVENSQDAFGKLLGLLEFQGHTAKAEIKHSRAARALVADDRVGICAGHGDAFGFALHRVGSWNRRSLFERCCSRSRRARGRI